MLIFQRLEVARLLRIQGLDLAPEEVKDEERGSGIREIKQSLIRRTLKISIAKE